MLHPNKKPVLVFPVAQKLSKEQTAVLSEVLSGSAGNFYFIYLFIATYDCFILRSFISWPFCNTTVHGFIFRNRKVLLAQKDYKLSAMYDATALVLQLVT